MVHRLLVRRLKLEGAVHLASVGALDHDRLVVDVLTLRIQKQSQGSQGGVLTVPCTFRRIIFQYSVRLLPSPSVSSSIISS